MPQTLPSVKSTLVIVESPAKCNKIEVFLAQDINVLLLLAIFKN